MKLKTSIVPTAKYLSDINQVFGSYEIGNTMYITFISMPNKPFKAKKGPIFIV